MVESGNEPVEVLCASNLDAAALNSTFPEVLQSCVALLLIFCCSTVSTQCLGMAGCSSCKSCAHAGSGSSPG